MVVSGPGLVRVDELEGPYGVECVSLANRAAAFFRISFSCSRTRTRRHSAAELGLCRRRSGHRSRCRRHARH